MNGLSLAETTELLKAYGAELRVVCENKTWRAYLMAPGISYPIVETSKYLRLAMDRAVTKFLNIKNDRAAKIDYANSHMFGWFEGTMRTLNRRHDDNWDKT